MIYYMDTVKLYKKNTKVAILRAIHCTLIEAPSIDRSNEADDTKNVRQFAASVWHICMFIGYILITAIFMDVAEMGWAVMREGGRLTPNVHEFGGGWAIMPDDYRIALVKRSIT